MSLAMSAADHLQSCSSSLLPRQVLELPPREREVASIVYSLGLATATQVELGLSDVVSNGAVRSMLTRLVHKGIVNRQWGRRGRGQKHIYMPALAPYEAKRVAVTDLANRFFDGSLAALANLVAELVEEESRFPRQFRNVAIDPQSLRAF
jgi:predicted transcriptional regulator